MALTSLPRKKDLEKTEKRNQHQPPVLPFGTLTLCELENGI